MKGLSSLYSHANKLACQFHGSWQMTRDPWVRNRLVLFTAEQAAWPSAYLKQLPFPLKSHRGDMNELRWMLIHSELHYKRENQSLESLNLLLCAKGMPALSSKGRLALFSKADHYSDFFEKIKDPLVPHLQNV